MERIGKVDWLSFLFGIILTIVGIAVLKNPTVTILTLINFFGLIVIIRGLMLIFAYYRIQEQILYRLKISLLLGILLIVIGIILLAWPAFVVRIFAYLVAIWFIIEAISTLVNSHLLRPAGKGLYALCLAFGILLLTGGVILLLHPLIVGLPISLFIGLSLMLFGVERIIFAFSNQDIYFL